jgi:hypothetical protein
VLTIGDINRAARDYVAAFAERGAATFIANLDTSLHLHRWGDHDLPVTVNDGTAGTTFVCSPRVGYIDYPLEELAHFPNPRLAPLLRGIVRGVGSVLLLCDAERIVHINNWMLSTNLPIPLDPALARKQTEELAANHPAHLLAMRSLTRCYNGPLMTALEEVGWVVLPSRQVFLIEDFARQCLSRRDFKRDEALWRRGDYRYEELCEMGANDAARIVDLYNMLYLEKHSRLNPAYTAEFVALTHQIGLIRYLVLRDGVGIIQGFGGMYQAGTYATMPLLGYNTAEPQDRGLYRLSFHAGTRYALDRQLQFNMSSGATGFKRNRGATAEMEFTAYYLRHLPLSRRAPFTLLRTVADRIGMPLLRTYEL